MSQDIDGTAAAAENPLRADNADKNNTAHPDPAILGETDDLHTESNFHSIRRQVKRIIAGFKKPTTGEVRIKLSYRYGKPELPRQYCQEIK